MDLPIALARMLEVSCSNDVLRNWSIYEERDGSYTFKIRFDSQKSRHVENSSPVVPCELSSFKKKSAKQQSRDNDRHKAWQERRITRSQTARIAAEMNSGDHGVEQAINKDSPVETFRCETQLSANSPEFRPSLDLTNLTDREIVDVECDMDSDSDGSYCPDHVSPGD